MEALLYILHENLYLDKSTKVFFWQKKKKKHESESTALFVLANMLEIVGR